MLGFLLDPSPHHPPSARLAFLAAGILHLFNPAPFLTIMPPWIPFPGVCVLVSGIFELLGAVGLLIPVRRIQFITGWGLTLLLVAVFPANIHMAIHDVQIPGLHIPSWTKWVRLPLQPLLIVAVAWVTGIWHWNCKKEGRMQIKPTTQP